MTISIISHSYSFFHPFIYQVEIGKVVEKADLFQQLCITILSLMIAVLIIVDCIICIPVIIGDYFNRSACIRSSLPASKNAPAP